MHDSFRDLVCDGFADDVEVGGDEPANEFGFEGLAVAEGGFCVLVELNRGRRVS